MQAKRRGTSLMKEKSREQGKNRHNNQLPIYVYFNEFHLKNTKPICEACCFSSAKSGCPRLQRKFQCERDGMRQGASVHTSLCVFVGEFCRTPVDRDPE